MLFYEVLILFWRCTRTCSHAWWFEKRIIFHNLHYYNTFLQGRAETFGGAGAQSIKGAHGTLILIGLCSLLICVSKWMLLY